MNEDVLRQDRPTVATIPVLRSLRTRLAVLAIVIITTVMGATTFFELQMFERAVERELDETGRLTAVTIADDLELREGPLRPEDVAQHLHEFIDASPELHSASIVILANGRPTSFATTDHPADADALEAGGQSIQRGELAWGRNRGSIRNLAVPLQRDGSRFGAVVVSISYGALDRLRTTGRTIALGATVAACIILVVLIELRARYVIMRPIDAIRTAMISAGAGQMSVRVPVDRPDEFGAIGAGLNHMLSQIEDLHTTLHQRVEAATDELRRRNRELANMYQQMFHLREELGRTQQLAAIGETAAVVAHQIGTPLNLISGHIQILIEEQGQSSAGTRRLQIAEEQIRKVTSTVRSLLDRVRLPVERERVELAGIVTRLCTLVQPAVESAGVTLSLQCHGVTPVYADVLQLEMALLNLVTNALDAMPEGGQLGIRVREDGERAVIEVADTGTGIQPELIDRIFDPLVTTKTAGRGTGLGLSITRSVVAEHGGSIRVSSTPGTGSKFTVELPIAADGIEEHADHA